MNTYPICDYAVDIALVYLLKKSSYKKTASSHKDYVRTKGYPNSTLKPLSFLSAFPSFLYIPRKLKKALDKYNKMRTSLFNFFF